MENDFSVDELWRRAMEAMKLTVSPAMINTYFTRMKLQKVSSVGERYICEIGCEAFVRDTVEKRYAGQFANEFSQLLGKTCEIQFSTMKVTPKKVESAPDMGPLFTEAKSDNDAWKRAKLKETTTFANYAVGGSNQMAFAAAQAVARRLGSTYNPLLIHGGVGVGKTHLMQAIGHEVIAHGETRVLFCTSEQFTNDLVEGIKNKSTEQVRAKYRRLKLLMIDDVQFIAGKGSAQEEFFHTFNAIAAEGGQIVMTSDRPPAEIPKLEERLRSRFGAGLIVDIEQPDMELRAAILLIKAGERGLQLDTQVAQEIAESIDGVRELEGFISRLITEQETLHQPVTAERIRAIIKQTHPVVSNTARVVTPQDVISTVGQFYGVGVAQLKGERRTKSLAWPRQILMYFLFHEMKMPSIEVGRLLGGRDHSTVLHARDKVLVESETNGSFRQELVEVRKKIFTS